MRNSASVSRGVVMFVATLLAAALAAHGQNVQSDPNGPASVLSQPIQYNGYGIHYPEGLSAVRFTYGPQGTWKRYTGLSYVDGYYSGWGGAVPNQQPTGTSSALLNALVAYANGANATSTPDANDHELWQLPQGGSTPLGTWYTSFHEHNGIGLNGAAQGAPFTQFWFDDNWLARYMSQAYGAPQPAGLWQPSNFNRWQILGLDSTNWTPYTGSLQPDQYALNGLYSIAVGNDSAALSDWNSLLSAAGTASDPATQRYTYPNITSEYQMGLFAILTEKLMDSGKFSAAQTNTFVQHFISLRSDILSDQQVENGTPIGWLSGDGSTSRTKSTTLINTETTAADVLALGAGAKYSFEAGQAPLDVLPTGHFFSRPYSALSAVVGQSTPGFMSYGPYMSFPAGSYTVDYYLRAPNPTGTVAEVDVNDYTQNKVLASQNVTAAQMQTGNQWTRVSLPVSIPNSTDAIELRVIWYGTGNLDVSAIRLR